MHERAFNYDDKGVAGGYYGSQVQVEIIAYQSESGSSHVNIALLNAVDGRGDSAWKTIHDRNDIDGLITALTYYRDVILKDGE